MPHLKNKIPVNPYSTGIVGGLIIIIITILAENTHLDIEDNKTHSLINLNNYHKVQYYFNKFQQNRLTTKKEFSKIFFYLVKVINYCYKIFFNFLIFLFFNYLFFNFILLKTYRTRILCFQCFSFTIPFTTAKSELWTFSWMYR